MDLQDLRMMEEEEARRRIHGHVVMLFSHRGLRRGRRDLCAWRGVRSLYACLFVCGSVIWVVLSRSEARRVLSWRVKWARRVVAMGLVRDRGGIWWNMVPASRWARTRHMRAGGEVLRDMMDSVGQWLYAVEMVWVCVRAMCPL
jgi:hypothetical protein